MIISLLLQDVAIKVFSKQEYSEDVILSFRQEVEALDNSVMLKFLSNFTFLSDETL